MGNTIIGTKNGSREMVGEIVEYVEGTLIAVTSFDSGSQAVQDAVRAWIGDRW